MPSPPVYEPGRRLLVAAGTEHFERLDNADLRHVPEELKRIATSFAVLGYERQHAVVRLDPKSDELRTLLADVKLKSRDGDVVVAYYTGHGARDLERFYLLTRNSTLSDLDGTALPAEDLARALTKDSKASQVLVILDACYAGAGAAEFGQIAHRFAAMLGAGPGVFVVAAARPKQEAEQGALSSALAQALVNDNERLGGRAQVFLAMDEVMEAVDGYLREKHPAQIATWSSANVRGRCRLFPNPRYRPEVGPGLDLETQRAFVEHWVPKARGAELGGGGWYFTGREQALREIARWLSAERSDGRARVVTGGAGCGKSAVLSRVVTLSDPTYRQEVLAETRSAMLDPATLPPVGVVNVAVHTRHKLLAETTTEIAAGLGLTVRDPSEVLEILACRPEKTVIVIDALDEADEKEQIAWRLLRPLAELPQIFLLVGTRPDSAGHDGRVRALGESTVEIDLDDPQYVGVDDVARYVERRLLAAEEPGRRTPYSDSPVTAHIVAQAVAERARNVFLVAHAAVQALLADLSVIDVTHEGWGKRLPAGLDAAFEQFLVKLDTQRPGGLSAAKTRAALLPLAFAEGEGLPWVNLWPAVATALSGWDVSDADIGLACKHAAPFIVEGIEQHRSVYRLYHECLAEVLRGSVGDAKETQQCIVAALRSQVPLSRATKTIDWIRAHPYLLTHLAAHALKAGKMDELAEDGMFMSAADPLRTLQALAVSTEPLARRAYACYSLAFDRLLDQPIDIRLSYLEMTARQQGDDLLAEIWGRAGPRRPWTVPWAKWSPVATHRTVHAPSWVHSVALGPLDDKPVIVSGCGDGTVRLWDFASGRPLCEPLRGHEGTVRSVAVGTLDGRPVIVSGGADGTVRVWDLGLVRKHVQPLSGHEKGVHSVALGTLDGRPVIVSGGADATVRVWDLRTGRQRGEQLRGHAGQVFSVALGTLDGRPVIVSGGADGTVRVWDLRTGRQRGEPLRGHENWVHSIALDTIDGQPKIVSGGADSTVRVWNLASDRLRNEPLLAHQGNVDRIALGTLDGGPVIATISYNDETVRVWDLASGRQRGEPLRGHQGGVHAVAMGTLDARPVIISGGADRAVRLWDLASGRELGEPLRTQGGCVYSVALGTLDGRPVIVSGTEEIVQVWDLTSHPPRATSLRGPVWGRVISVALTTLDGRSVIVAHEGITVRVWDLASGTPYGVPLREVHSAALDTLDSRLVVVSGGSDGSVQLWDLASGRRLGKPLRGHKKDLVQVALGTLRGRPVIVSAAWLDETVQVWNADGTAPADVPVDEGDLLFSVRLGSGVRALTFAGPGTVVIAAHRGLLLLKFATDGIGVCSGCV
jgi:WD40 repeat protein